MVVNQSAYVPDWAKSPPEGHAACTVEQLNAVNQKCFTLDKRALLFGRVDQVCDIVVSHVSASRVHACLAFDADVKLHVADLGSTHGTRPLVSYHKLSMRLAPRICQLIGHVASPQYLHLCQYT